MTKVFKRAQEIEQRLNKGLNINFLEIENQSARHHGHGGDDGSGESHFLISIDATELKSLNRIQQHRKIIEVIENDLYEKIHSISIRVR